MKYDFTTILERYGKDAIAVMDSLIRLCRKQGVIKGGHTSRGW